MAYGDRPGDSWIVRDRDTGRGVLETFDRRVADAINTEKYDVVPALQHLQECNTPGTRAYAACRRLP